MDGDEPPDSSTARAARRSRREDLPLPAQRRRREDVRRQQGIVADDAETVAESEIAAVTETEVGTEFFDIGGDVDAVSVESDSDDGAGTGVATAEFDSGRFAIRAQLGAPTRVDDETRADANVVESTPEATRSLDYVLAANEELRAQVVALIAELAARDRRDEETRASAEREKGTTHENEKQQASGEMSPSGAQRKVPDPGVGQPKAKQEAPGLGVGQSGSPTELPQHGTSSVSRTASSSRPHGSRSVTSEATREASTRVASPSALHAAARSSRRARPPAWGRAAARCSPASPAQ